MIDSLLSVRIMLPNTTVVEASTKSNPDLFWGIRGAGFNFGFVLNATYRVYNEAPNGQNLNADFQYPYNVSAAFYQALKNQAFKLPPSLCITHSLQWDATRNEVIYSSYTSVVSIKSQAFLFVTDKISDDAHRQCRVCWARRRGTQSGCIPPKNRPYHQTKLNNGTMEPV